MLRSLENLIGYNLISKNGEDIGKVKDFYFDSNELIVRYAVVDTGGWLTGRKVLISPESFKKPDWKKEIFPVDLTKEEIENGPSIDEERPVSRQVEVDLTEHYDWPVYWAPMAGSQEMAGAYTGAYPARPAPVNLDTLDNGEGDSEDSTRVQDLLKDQESEEACDDENCYLRSYKEVKGYSIHALDDEIGHLETLMISDENWIVHYLVVDTRNWLPGPKVLVAPEWLNRVSYANKEVEVELHKDTIKNAPEYDPDNPITREYEENIYAHYDKDTYW